MPLCLTKLGVILEIDPYVISLDFFSMKELSQRLQIFKACHQEWFFITDKGNVQNLR